MNIVKSSGKYTVYGDAVQTFTQLPVSTYEVQFSKMSGFYLTPHNDLEVREKIYGPYAEKVNKVLKTFGALNRNMGVILSGPKGVGKSMFARQLATVGNVQGLPLILVSQAFPGIDSFISSIEQECIVLFDEFEKSFAGDGEFNPQDSLLSLFDGIDNGKKLYVITCNDTNKLSSFLLNRPGRFHYHFTLDVPEAEYVREYLNDNLADSAKHYVERIVGLSKFSMFTYDVLRAIVFELNQGYDLSETLADLNIERNRFLSFRVSLEFANGIIIKDPDIHRIDTFSGTPTPCYDWVEFDKKDLPESLLGIVDDVKYEFSSDDIVISEQGYSIDADDVEVIFSSGVMEEAGNNSELRQFIDSCTVKRVSLEVLPDNRFSTKFLL